MGRRRSLPTIDVSPSDSDVEIVSQPMPPPAVAPPGRPQKVDGPSMSAFPLTRLSAERKFWSKAEESTDDTDDLQPAGVPRRRWTVRSLFSKLLFLAIAVGVLLLVACEVSIVLKLPWLDPRPALARAMPTIARAGHAMMGKISHWRDR